MSLIFKRPSDEAYTAVNEPIVNTDVATPAEVEMVSPASVAIVNDVQ